MSSHIINNIKNINDFKYLELGVCDCVNFNSIKCLDKTSVDINGKAMFNGTTDSFFSQNEKTFDIIYIDANHDCEFVIRDFNNSIKFCNKMIMIHDMIPPTKMHTESRYCSDSYKILYYFYKNGFNFFSLNEDFGLTFVFPSFKDINFNNSYNISYEEFLEFMKDKKLKSWQEAIDYLNQVF